jgi:amino-acid N-acetyltransferase
VNIISKDINLESITCMPTVEQAQPDQLAAIEELLRQSGLPPEGLAEHLASALVARDGAAVVGSAALECYGDAALLRSVAVAPAYRGRGLGCALVSAALELARSRGIRTVALLTTSAPAYFPRFGFQRTDRAALPQALLQSAEYTHLCPDSAIVMQTALA